MSDDAVERVLSSKLELPASAKVALLKFPDGSGSRYTMRRVEQALAVESLQAAAEDLVAFLRSAPRKGN